MIRFVFLAILAYVLYRLVKKYIFGSQDTYVESGRRNQQGYVEDEVIRDPHCGVYCPKREMISANVEGSILYFCSENCRNAYLQEHEQKEARSER